jgi:hypothetical protein
MHCEGLAFENSLMICSPICLVYPYGDSAGLGGVNSVTGILSGLPYTVQEEEKTKWGILNSATHFNRLISENILFSKYNNGCSTDSPTALKAAK